MGRAVFFGWDVTADRSTARKAGLTADKTGAPKKEPGGGRENDTHCSNVSERRATQWPRYTANCVALLLRLEVTDVRLA
ncbi:hypothetical protein P3T23_004231 [Paraburkholderia sp. GAS448]